MMATDTLLKKLDLACPVNCRPDIPVRGDAPTEPIFWYRKQWAITPIGLEARDGTYFIEARRLWEEEAHWGWVMQMTEKTWIDIEDFLICLAVARVFHAELAPTV